QDCGTVENWDDRQAGIGKFFQADGEGFYLENFIHPLPEARLDTDTCASLLGRNVFRGDVIGYSGNVGGNDIAAIGLLVRHDALPNGSRSSPPFTHVVQPRPFFYWTCFSPRREAEAGVLTYPFECGEYRLPEEERRTTFKYGP
ncbi:MAG: hypothetical protein AAB932_03405, partial [Patescibacteria group bacterium]